MRQGAGSREADGIHFSHGDFQSHQAIIAAIRAAAAALGKPVVLLAPHNVCWRWDMGGVESPWYPGVKVFRARGQGEWSAVVDSASAAIAEAAAGYL